MATSISKRGALAPGFSLLALLIISLTSPASALPAPALAHSILARFGNAPITNDTTPSIAPSSGGAVTTSYSSVSSMNGANLAGIIIGLIGVVLLFVTVFIVVMRYRAKKRRDERNHEIYKHGAVQQSMMDSYARDQKSALLKGRQRSDGSGVSGGVKKPSRVVVRGSNGVRAGGAVGGDDSPPGYYDDWSPPRL